MNASTRDAGERDRLLDAITDRPGRRLAALATATRIPVTVARGHLRDLVEAGAIYQPNPHNHGWWPTPPGEQPETDPPRIDQPEEPSPMPNSHPDRDAKTAAVLGAVEAAGAAGIRAVEIGSAAGVGMSTVYRILSANRDKVEVNGERGAHRWYWSAAVGEPAAEVDDPAEVLDAATWSPHIPKTDAEAEPQEEAEPPFRYHAAVSLLLAEHSRIRERQVELEHELEEIDEAIVRLGGDPDDAEVPF